MTLHFKPQLAINVDDVTKLPQNMSVSVKLDGIRAICWDGVMYSRSLKPIPNKAIQAWSAANAAALQGLDGELIVGEANASDVFNKTTSVVMSHDKTDPFVFYVFDSILKPELPFKERFKSIEGTDVPGTKVLVHYDVSSVEDIDQHEAMALAAGYEGLMVRNSDAPYKYGRAGKVYPQIMKVKRFSDAEFEVVGVECEYENTNEAKTNELGRTARSTSLAGLVPKESLGTLLLKCQKTGKTFNCGGGFTKAQREEFWLIRDSLIGKLARVKYFEIGIVDVPRFPVWQGFRDERDT